jgi:ubiquinone/menaquinone biosynthesis C-methylase UbiE
MCNLNDDLWEWSVFWHSNQLHSCMPVDADPDALGSVWRDFFCSLPAGASILDLGTGNGSLAAQAVTVSRSKSPPFSIHGVDLADIHPSRYVANADKLLSVVTFHPRTAMENLPFEAQSFDAIGSQYAIEYSNIKQSLPEVVRVLKPGGRLRFLLHSNNGILKDRCHQQYEQAQTILASELFATTTDLLVALVEAETNNTPQTIRKAEEQILRLKNVFDELEKKFSKVGDRSLIDKLFAAVRNLPGLRKFHKLQALTKMSENIQLLLLAQSKRLLAMQQAALDDIKVNEMAEQLRLLKIESVSLEVAKTATGARSLGYWLSAEKPATMDEGLL